MGRITYRLSLIAVSAGLISVAVSIPASAHVTVRPAEAVTAGYQTFTVSVPNEREVSTTGIKVVIPENVLGATPTQKANWSIAIEKQGEGDSSRVSSISWTGGEITEGTRDEFTFSAKVPDTEGDLRWNAYQTYADGVIVSWDQQSEGGHGTDENKGPFSVTKVVAESSQDAAIKRAEQKAEAAQATTRLAFYAAIAAVGVGLIGVYLGSKKGSQ